MDINKLALELQQNQSVRQKIYAQYMNNQDDFFFQNFHGILEEKVLFEYLQHAQKQKIQTNPGRKYPHIKKQIPARVNLADYHIYIGTAAFFG